MLGLPDDWNYSTVGLASIVKESKNTIHRLLKELPEKNNIKLIVILYLVIWNTCILNIKIYNNCLCEKVLAKKYKVVYNNFTI